MKTLIDLKNRFVEFTLLDLTWKAYLMTVKEYERLVDKDSRAMTYLESREIVFKLDEFDMSTVRHELMHALIHCSIGATELDMHEFEEVVCEQYGTYGPRLAYLGKKVYKSLLLFLK